MTTAWSTVGESETDQGLGKGGLTCGARLGSWVIEALEAQGGQGSVYRVRHVETSAAGAIKVLHRSLLSLPHMVTRFLREVEVILRLGHPNIVRIDQLGALPDGTPYYVMEHLHGKTLRALLRERGRLDLVETLAILEPVCAALEAAHALGIIHRDVKASNIMITSGPDPSVKLLDFGIAKLMTPEGGESGLTSVGQQLGTPSIMAPEQILGGRIDARTDVYALGALLYTMTTGRPVFESIMPADLVQQHLDAPPPRPSQRVPLSPELDAVVIRCLDKRPENRYPTVTAFLEGLRDVVSVSAGVKPSAVVERHAAALFVEVRLRDTSNVDDEVLELMGTRVLERAEACMKSRRLSIAFSTSNAILGLLLLSDDSSYACKEKQTLLELGRTLRRVLPEGAADTAAPVHVNMALHADQVTVHLGGAEPEIVSGAIAQTETWAPDADADGLRATHAFLDGLIGISVDRDPNGHCRIVARKSSISSSRNTISSITEVSRD